MNFVKIPRTTFSLNTSGRLLLKVVCINRAGQLQIFKTYLGLNHLSVSYALGHNDARGWGYHFNQNKLSNFKVHDELLYISLTQKKLFRGVLEKSCSENCSKFTEEHPCRSAVSIKLLATSS